LPIWILFGRYSTGKREESRSFSEGAGVARRRSGISRDVIAGYIPGGDRLGPRIIPAGYVLGIYEPTTRVRADPFNRQDNEIGGPSANAAAGAGGDGGGRAAAAGLTQCWCGKLSAPAALTVWLTKRDILDGFQR
jgi:hypothetical protein